MSTIKPAYQTQKYESKYQSNPVYCGRTDKPWLTEGYYFWHGFIELAHWWGRDVRKYHKYCIFESEIEYNDDNFLDLVGNVDDIKAFKLTYDELREKRPDEEFTVPQVLKFMLKISPEIKVIRAKSQHQIGSDSRLAFVETDRSFMEVLPPIQVCVTDNKLIKKFDKVFTS